MFIRSRDGKHLIKAKNADLEGSKILVNGVVFADYEDTIVKSHSIHQTD